IPHTPQPVHGQDSTPRSADQAPRSHRDNASAHNAPRAHKALVPRLAVAEYHLEHRRCRDTRSMIGQAAESKAPDRTSRGLSPVTSCLNNSKRAKLTTKRP
ncbi:hypothetical protein JG688_00013578, partial [Phytophthora aleatoria]